MELAHMTLIAAAVISIVITRWITSTEQDPQGQQDLQGQVEQEQMVRTLREEEFLQLLLQEFPFLNEIDAHHLLKGDPITWDDLFGFGEDQPENTPSVTINGVALNEVQIINNMGVTINRVALDDDWDWGNPVLRPKPRRRNRSGFKHHSDKERR